MNNSFFTRKARTEFEQYKKFSKRLSMIGLIVGSIELIAVIALAVYMLLRIR